MKDHLPALQQLQALNMFGFGLSPGKFGGINAPLINNLFGDPLAHDKGIIFNLFTPHGVSLQNAGMADHLKNVIEKSIPAINDIHYLIQNMKEQGHVLFDPSHQTEAAQARDGFAQWTDFKKGVKASLDQYGASWADMQRNPQLADLKASYDQKKAELEHQYPGWAANKLKGLEHAAELNQESTRRISLATYSPQLASPLDKAYAGFEGLVQNYKQTLAQLGITDWTEMDPSDFDYLRAQGIALARAVPGFDMLWNKFYFRDFGPIESEVA
jgi:hypothetical protein